MAWSSQQQTRGYGSARMKSEGMAADNTSTNWNMGYPPDAAASPVRRGSLASKGGSSTASGDTAATTAASPSRRGGQGKYAGGQDESPRRKSNAGLGIAGSPGRRRQHQQQLPPQQRPSLALASPDRARGSSFTSDLFNEDASQSPTRSSYRDQLRANGQALQRFLHTNPRSPGASPPAKAPQPRLNDAFGDVPTVVAPPLPPPAAPPQAPPQVPPMFGGGGGDASSRRPLKPDEDSSMRGVSMDSYFNAAHSPPLLGRERYMPQLHGVHNTLLSVQPQTGTDMMANCMPPDCVPGVAAPVGAAPGGGYAAPPMGAANSAGSGLDLATMGAAMSATASVGAGGMAPTGGASELLMKIAMSQCFDRDEISKELLAAEPEQYED